MIKKEAKMVNENEYCTYMQQKYPGNCEWFYENRHSSDRYCCVRPEITAEDIVGQLCSIRYKNK